MRGEGRERYRGGEKRSEVNIHDPNRTCVCVSIILLCVCLYVCPPNLLFHSHLPSIHPSTRLYSTSFLQSQLCICVLHVTIAYCFALNVLIDYR